MLTLELVVLIVSVGTGAFGALVGVGGGIILVPVLTLFLGIPVPTAVAISLLGVIAISTTASAAYLEDGFVDRRLGLTLLIATTLGGVVGGYVAGYLSVRLISALFGVVLLVAAIQMLRGRREAMPEFTGKPSGLEFDSIYIEPTSGTAVTYRARRVGAGAFVSLFAGAVSGLLGVGGGIINVPTMNVLMGVPIRVATTTSTYMLGATAAASAVLYLSRGEVDFALAAPAVIGVVVGGRIGARLQPRVPVQALSLVLVALSLFFAVQMLIRVINS